MEAIRKVYQYAEPNLTLVGWMGFLGFPTYYFVWANFFPQPYENWWLRMVCALLFLVIIFRNKLSHTWRKLMPYYYQGVITLCLPYFFFFMLLMNDWSNVWVMSFMSAIFLHILLVHVTRVMFIQTFIGLTSATFSVWALKGFHLELTLNWAHVPIFFFIYLFGNLFYFRNQVEHEAKVSLAKSFGAGIAHEMRNPLSGLCTSIDIIQSIVPDPKSAKQSRYELSFEDITLLREVSDDAMKIIHSGNETIDLLLTSIDENRVSRSTFKKHAAREVVESAIESFSYKRATDRFAVSLDVRDEFEFLGSDTLLKYVVYNLFKNAFHHRANDDFHIHVEMKVAQHENRIVVTDNGPGIPPEIIGNIFRDFYTTGRSGNYGLGLPFCKKVLRSFGGKIECESELMEWTRFTLRFPLIDSDKVSEIKSDLTKLKSVLFISDHNVLTAKATEIANVLGFQLELQTVDSVLQRKEYEFEYDLIMVDIDHASAENNHQEKLESLLTFTEARIIYLFQRHPALRPTKIGFEPIWIETQAWLLNTRIMFDRLMFDASYTVARAPQVSAPEQSKRTIMVVDDNESLRKFTSMLLEKQGFDVIQREDGKQALEALNDEHVDLILMDIEMPVMDGVEASRRIRSSNREYADVPIIAHTGDSSPVTLDRIGSSGMSDFIVKPADKNRLFDKIANWI
ncbi:hybrid sensor histidine kinase/response regulator [Vibrio sp. CAU 1672]|uniref:hybrid sensor histidine kinase/response regulator n=1 Tax=Vibrio sp. CAU 1672 TaxID=3032594 RepID=UPI0023DC5391|nr:hybrid sensor histidine kinase/response regulator [Vibrio sp. CAU 1672]MDF2155420.1 hybrid sensor histidine kinase/response regulator [Vibrio sp. CAU 1672]